MPKSKFLRADDAILRLVYPLFGSRGVINILPQFKTAQVNMRAYTLGVKFDADWKEKVALAKQTGDAPAYIKVPDRLRIRHIYPNAVDRLAYARPWA